MWISRASRGRLDKPLSCREVRGTMGLPVVAGAGCEGCEAVGAVVDCVGGEADG
jgi:hypothetical protein